MRSLLKGAALAVATSCVVWILVLWRWRATQRDMDAGDVVIYLCLLPVIVFVLALAMRWAVRGALANQGARAASVPAAVASGAAALKTPSFADEQAPVAWHFLGAWANTAGGASIDELLAATEAGSPRPRPDDALHDDDGLPVITARIADRDLDVEAVDGALRRLLAAAPTAIDGRTLDAPPPRAMRALAILSPLIDELTQSLHVWSQQWSDAAASVVGYAPPSATSLPLAPTSAPESRIVRVLASWPADWDDATCGVAREWLSERLCEPLAAVLPPARWSIRSARMSGTELLSAAQRILAVLEHQGRDDPVVLLACHSDLDDTGIRALEAAQRLFHPSRRPRVSMAAEGAAVLVFSAVAWPADAAIDTERVRLTSPAIVRRSQSIEAAGRTASTDAAGIVRLGLARAGVSSATVAKLVCDADQHTARATELFAVTLALLPELDASEDLCLVGSLTGRLEAVAPLVAFACAAAQARASGQPAVALSLADPHWRVAAVLTPDSALPTLAPAHTPAVAAPELAPAHTPAVAAPEHAPA